MMSARSPSPTSTWNGPASPLVSSSHCAGSSTSTARRGGDRSAPASITTGASRRDVRATVGSASPTMAASSRAVSRTLVGTVTAPALWMAA